MSKPFTAYWNMPGCLPEVEPQDFDTKEDALRYLADEISNEQDDFYTMKSDVDEAICNLLENGWVHFNGYFYGIGE